MLQGIFSWARMPDATLRVFTLKTLGCSPSIAPSTHKAKKNTGGNFLLQDNKIPFCNGDALLKFLAPEPLA